MRLFALAALSILLAACSRPVPPTLTPKRASITSISSEGFALDLVLGTTNPNDFDLTAGDVTAHVVIDGHIDVGTATFPQTVTLSANSAKDVEVPLSVRWLDLVPLVGLAVGDRDTIPYTVDGSLSLGGGTIRLPIPFHFAGTVTREQIARVTANSIPGLPGFSILPGSSPVPPPPKRRKPAP